MFSLALVTLGTAVDVPVAAKSPKVSVCLEFGGEAESYFLRVRNIGNNSTYVFRSRHGYVLRYVDAQGKEAELKPNGYWDYPMPSVRDWQEMRYMDEAAVFLQTHIYFGQDVRYIAIRPDSKLLADCKEGKQFKATFEAFGELWFPVKGLRPVVTALPTRIFSCPKPKGFPDPFKWTPLL